MTKPVIISLKLEPGSDEYRAYNRIKRKYHDEMNRRQKSASDDDPCETNLRIRDVGRGSLLALADVPQEKIPEYIHANVKQTGRRRLNADRDEQADSYDALEDRADTLPH